MNEYQVTYEDLNTHEVDIMSVQATSEDDARTIVNNEVDKIVLDIN